MPPGTATYYGKRAARRWRYDRRMPWKRVLVLWCLIAGVETIHGILRRLYLDPVIGVLNANHIGVFVGLGLILLICLATSRWIGPRSTLGWMQVGLVLVVLTLAFEFAVGLALGYSVYRILADYDPSRGGLMLLGMIGLLYAPRFAARLRGTLS
jgi:hypothetical protein